jgi:CBS domain-containing protein
MTAGELCARDVEVAEPQDRVRDAAQRLKERGAATLVVVDGLRRPLGIVTLRDLVWRGLVAGRDPARTPLERVMSGPPAWVHEGAEIDAALEEMARLRVRRLPVVDAHERLVGMLTLDAVLAARLEPASALARALRANL